MANGNIYVRMAPARARTQVRAQPGPLKPRARLWDNARHRSGLPIYRRRALPLWGPDFQWPMCTHLGNSGAGVVRRIAKRNGRRAFQSGFVVLGACAGSPPKDPGPPSGSPQLGIPRGGPCRVTAIGTPLRSSLPSHHPPMQIRAAIDVRVRAGFELGHTGVVVEDHRC